MRHLFTFAVLTAFTTLAPAAPPCEVAASVRVDCPQGGGVTHSGSGTVVEDGVAQRFPTLAKTCPCVSAPGGVGTCGSYACPANGGRGGCPCTCTTGRWKRHKDDEPGDLGWYVGDEFKGRWIAKASTYRAWDGKSYGPPIPFADPFAACKRPVYSAPPSFGGCAGGSCRGR